MKISEFLFVYSVKLLYLCALLEGDVKGHFSESSIVIM